MAKFFSQSDIDLFKECFFFNVKRGYTQSDEELGLVMRSLGYSPTPVESKGYYKKYEKDNKIDFAAFLEVMHDHSQKENTMAEVMNAFKAHDRDARGYVQTNEVKNILLNLGEKLNRREVDALFRDGNVTGSQIRYQEFVNSIQTPVPDY